MSQPEKSVLEAEPQSTSSMTTLEVGPTEAANEDVEAVTEEKASPALDGERSIKGFKWILAVLAILSSTFLFALDTTVVADIQPKIINSLGEFEKFPWLGAAFVLPAAALVLPWSKAYSLFNVKWLYIAHVFIFEVGSAISASSPTMNALIVGRAIAGIGGCGMYVGGLTFFSVITTPKERPIYISLITPVWGIGTVLGPIVGGAFADSPATWRWGFYINLLIFAVFAPVMVFILPSLDFALNLSYKQKLSKFDWLGLVIFIGWCISFVMALQFGGTVFKWRSASEIVLWVMSGVLGVVFILTQKFHPFIDADNKLYPGHMLKNWKLGILQFATFAASSAVYIPIYYIPLYFQFARGETALASAVRLLPFVFMVVLTSLLNGFFMSKFGYYMPWFFVGGVLGLIGAALMYTVTTSTTNAAVYGYSVVIGLGGGCILLTAFGCASDVVEVSDVFNAIGVLSVSQGIGIVFFVSAAGIIFQNLGVKYIQPFLPADFTGDPHTILAGTSSPVFLSFSEQTQQALSAAIISAMGKVYGLSIAATAITTVLSVLLGKGKVG